MVEFLRIMCHFEKTLLFGKYLDGKMDSAVDYKQTRKVSVIEINGLSISLYIFDTPAFLGEILENITLFMIPENDVNKTRKKISVEVLSLIGSGKPKDALLFFDPECKTHNPY